MEIALLFVSFIVLILLTVPVGYAIGISTLLTLFFFPSLPVVMISQNAVAGVDSFPLMAIPFFILAGNLMNSGGIAKRLLDFVNVFFGVITGGLAMVTTVTCMFFSALSGSAVATTSAVGAFMIPAMKEKKYDIGFSTALAASAGTIGIIIPPSIPLVIYGVVVGASITDLFIAGLLPGIIMGLVLVVACYIVSKKKGYVGSGEPITLKRLWVSFKRAFWALMSPGIILGGIYSGIFTPTEAAVVAVVYSIIVGICYKELNWRGLYQALADTICINGVTTYMVGISMAFAAYLSVAGIPQTIAEALLGLASNKVVLFVLVNLFLLLVGSLIDCVPAIIILSPILLPVMTQFGMDPITFGVVIVANLAIGFITPPYGINLFVAMAVGNVTMERMMKYVLVFFLAMVAGLLIITFVEPLTMGLVRVFA